MPRRDPTTASGYVNFPTDDPAYRFSNEGGMFVRLAVLVPKNRGDWLHCCGGSDSIRRTECLLGSETDGAGETEKLLFPLANARWERNRKRMEQARLEGRDDPEEEEATLEEEYSAELLAAITLGSTGWIGWHVEREEYWRCRREDLSNDGRRLVELIEALYPGCTTVITTWLDTRERKSGPTHPDHGRRWRQTRRSAAPASEPHYRTTRSRT